MLNTPQQGGGPPERTIVPRGRIRRFPRHERGAFAVMTAALALLILGFCGFALDLSRSYNRKVELQTIADAMALAAAAQLNGTAQGIDNALSAASKVSSDYAMGYGYGKLAVPWSSTALRFGAAPSGSEWVDAGGAKGQAATMFFVEVDTRRLGESIGQVDLVLFPVPSPSTKSADIAGRAVAGRSTVNVMPLAVCAMSEKRGSARGDELVEHGFRRGISYNLMQLNPDENTGGAHFLVNPVAQPGTTGTSAGTRLDVVRPFVCTGTMAMPQVTAGTLSVERGFPLNAVFAQLNSRFGTYTAPCTANGAPPDANVREYSGTLSWMTDKPRQSADSRKTDTKLLTIADLDETPAGTTADLYGPLWIYAKAVKYADYASGVAEPEPDGYTPFVAKDDWSKLYTPGSPKLKGTYPSPTPYKAITTPGGTRSVANRRVLNVPLLRCPVTGSPASAQVLAIGKFFMTVRATDTDLIAEFAGLAKPELLGGQVELYP